MGDSVHVDSKQSPPADAEESRPPVVAIGASAGGLQALKAFFDALPTDTGMAFVVLMHLSPEHTSNLADILQNHTSLSVTRIEDGMKLEPNGVYVLPPKTELYIEAGRLQLVEVTHREHQPGVIDTFFEALAKDQGEQAIGMILSGTGSDGQKGIRAIKEQGGFTMVQDPGQAEHGGMPRHAIETDLVDVVAPVEMLAADLMRYWSRAAEVQMKEEAKDFPEEDEKLLRKILEHVYAESGHDFSNYKRSTIMRRIARRLTAHRLQKLDEYLKLLRRDADEVDALFKEFLISVTSFFRYPEAFEALKKDVIPKLFEGKDFSDQVRVWSVGCATGEEVYSLAMLLHEYADQLQRAPEIQIFATDISEDALETARNGVYPEAATADLTSEQVERYLVEEGQHYRIRRELREMILFADHDLLEDPPFSKLDLVSCRNLLIYLNRTMQEYVFKLLHYALRPGGYLLLGMSESVTSASRLFSEIDRKHALYKRRPSVQLERPVPLFPLQKRINQEVTAELGQAPKQKSPETVEELHHRLLVDEVASIVVDEDYNILHLTDRAARYLGYKGGTPSHNVLEAVPRKLRTELRSGLYQAFEKGKETKQKQVEVEFQGTLKQLTVRVSPGGEVKSFAQIILIETKSPQQPTEIEAEEEPSAKHVAQLEEELRKTKEQLEATIEEYETTTEEMESSNEELLSMNEELQSKNEEIETSKEEVQSVNEELEATNQELIHKVEELRRTNSDLQNLMEATDIATLFLDRQLCIKRMTPRVQELFNVRPDDTGRPLSDFSHNLGYDRLIDDANQVLDRLQPIEREVEGKDGKWFLVQLRPYRTLEDKIDGVVITFVNITEMKAVHREAEEAREYAEEIVDTVQTSLLVLDEDLRVKTANDAFYETFQVEPDDTVGTLVYDLGNQQWDIPELRTLLRDILQESEVVTDYVVEHKFESLGHRIMHLNARRIDNRELILLSIEDVTQSSMMQKLREERNFIESLLETVGALVIVVDVDGRIVRFNKECQEVTGYSAEEAEGRKVFDFLIPPEDQQGVQVVMEEHEAGRDQTYSENEWITKDGERRLIRWSSTVLRDTEGEIEYIIGTGIDITERRQLERELLSISDQERRRIGQDLHDLLASQLAGTSMMAQSLAVRLERGEDIDIDMMHKVVDLINTSGEQARALSHMLMPLEVHGGKLKKGLRNLAAREEKMTGIPCIFTAEDGVPDCSTDISSHLYRIATEAIHNAVKHANPDRIDVTLSVDDDQLILTVEDDGAGIDPDAFSEDGIGLHMMEYRANLIGASLSFEKADEGGTKVKCRLPLSKAVETSGQEASGPEAEDAT